MSMTSEALLKYLAVVFLFLLMVGSAAVAGLEIIEGLTPNVYAISIMSSGLGYALTAAGVLHGSAISQFATDSANSNASTVVEAARR